MQGMPPPYAGRFCPVFYFWPLIFLSIFLLRPSEQKNTVSLPKSIKLFEKNLVSKRCKYRNDRQCQFLL